MLLLQKRYANLSTALGLISRKAGEQDTALDAQDLTMLRAQWKPLGSDNGLITGISRNEFSAFVYVHYRVSVQLCVSTYFLLNWTLQINLFLI